MCVHSGMHGYARHSLALIGITLACHTAMACNANPSDDRTDSPSRQRVESAGLAHDVCAECRRDRKEHDLAPILGEPACRTAYTTCLNSINPAHNLASRRFSESVLNHNSMHSSLLSVGYLLRHPNRTAESRSRLPRMRTGPAERHVRREHPADFEFEHRLVELRETF